MSKENSGKTDQELTEEEQDRLVSEYFSEIAKKGWVKRRQKFLEKMLEKRRNDINHETKVDKQKS